MVVKEIRGRRRYIAFTVSEGISKEHMTAGLKRVCENDNKPYVIQCGGGWAIVRCAPKDVDSAISDVIKVDANAVSLRTSGTLKTLRSRYSELEKLRPPRRM